MTKQGDQPIKASPAKESLVKENVVAGVLQNYLDQLLITATSPQKIEKAILIPEFDDTDYEKSNPAVEISEAPKEVPVEVNLAQVELVRVDSPIPVEVIDEQQVTSKTNDRVFESATAIESAVKQSFQPLIDQESWSSQGVECLVFSVGGLKLAVPLLLLGGVHEVDASDVKPLMGQPQWYLGMIHKGEQSLQVIDTANFIMPEREQSLTEQGYKYLIQLEKTPWAIACQSIDDTVRLEAAEIKWRGDRGKRAWLAGTVIEKMCALIDVSGLLQQVELSCKPV